MRGELGCRPGCLNWSQLKAHLPPVFLAAPGHSRVEEAGGAGELFVCDPGGTERVCEPPGSPEAVMSGADTWITFLDLFCGFEGQLIGSLVIFEWGYNNNGAVRLPPQVNGALLLM